MSKSANHNVNRIGAATEQIAQSVGDAVRDLPDHLKHLNRRAAEGLGTVGGMANDALRHGRDSLERIESAVENRVRNRPWHALLIAVGVGAAIAWLVSPRRR